MTNKKQHNYNLGDLVKHPCDAAPFEVVGVRNDQIEIKGDWSGVGYYDYSRIDAPTEWVNPSKVKPYDETKVVYYIQGKPFKNGQPLNAVGGLRK